MSDKEKCDLCCKKFGAEAGGIARLFCTMELPDGAMTRGYVVCPKCWSDDVVVLMGKPPSQNAFVYRALKRAKPRKRKSVKI